MLFVVACDKWTVVKTVCSYVYFSFMWLSYLEDLFSNFKGNIKKEIVDPSTLFTKTISISNI